MENIEEIQEENFDKIKALHQYMELNELKKIIAPGYLTRYEAFILNEINYNFLNNNKKLLREYLIKKFNNREEAREKLRRCIMYVQNHKYFIAKNNIDNDTTKEDDIENTSNDDNRDSNENTLDLKEIIVNDYKNNNDISRIKNIKNFYPNIKYKDAVIKQYADIFEKLLSNRNIQIGKYIYNDKDICRSVFNQGIRIFKKHLSYETQKDLDYIDKNFANKVMVNDNTFKLYYRRFLPYCLFNDDDKCKYLILLVHKQKKDFLENTFRNEIEENFNVENCTFGELYEHILNKYDILNIDQSDILLKLLDFDANFDIDWNKIREDFNKEFKTNANIAELRLNYYSQFNIDIKEKNNENYINNKLNLFKTDNRIKFYLSGTKEIAPNIIAKVLQEHNNRQRKMQNSL